MLKHLKEIDAKIENGMLLVERDGKFSKIDYTHYHDYSSSHLRIDRRIRDIALLNNYLDGEKMSESDTKDAKHILETTKIENETGLHYGAWVKFKTPYDSFKIIEGYIESPWYDNTTVTTNIERNQFSGHNSWGNYVVKGMPLREIKQHLVEYEPALLPLELLPRKVLIAKESMIEQIAHRYNTTPDKVSNIQIDDEDESITATITGICKYCNCGWIEEYASTLDKYKEKII